MREKGHAFVAYWLLHTESYLLVILPAVPQLPADERNTSKRFRSGKKNKQKIQVSGHVVVVRLVGCGFKAHPSRTKTVEIAPIGPLLGTQYSGLKVGR